MGLWYLSNVSFIFFCSVGIAPWNVPVTLAIRAVAVPIICGNHCCFKNLQKSVQGVNLFVAKIFHEFVHSISSLPDAR